MPDLTDEEQRILALMKQLDAAQSAVAPPAAAPTRPLPERFTDMAFLDKDGQPYPDARPLPTPDEAAAENRRLIAVLEAQLAQAEAGTPVVPPGPARRRR